MVFASLNPHISGVDQPTLTNFGTLVEAFGVQFRAKARRDRSNHFDGIDNEVHGKCGKNWHPLNFGAP